MKNKYSFKVDCPEIDIDGISLCEKKVHGDTFYLNIKVGMELNIKQLKEFIKLKDHGLDNHQWWKLTLEKVKKK